MVKMQPGDIVFVRGTSFISKLIMKYDKGNFSHVAIAVSDTHVLEAQSYTKSRIVPIYFKDYEVIDLGLTDEERQLVVDNSKLLVGRSYDYLQILSILFKLKLNNVNSLICSELVVLMLMELDIVDMDEYFELINYTPNQLYNYLKGEIFSER